MIPENEMGVIVEFARQADKYGFEIVRIGASYPDATVRINGTEYRTEFEFASSCFFKHRHDPHHCDIVICWLNDYPDCALTVFALSEQDWQNTTIVTPDKRRLELEYWRIRALAAEAELQAAKHKPAIDDVPAQYVCIDCGQGFTERQKYAVHRRWCTVRAANNGHKQAVKEAVHD